MKLRNHISYLYAATTITLGLQLPAVLGLSQLMTDGLPWQQLSWFQITNRLSYEQEQDWQHLVLRKPTQNANQVVSMWIDTNARNQHQPGCLHAPKASRLAAGVP
jgi:hypothetical protein